MPDQTVDSIVVASQIVNALQTIVARNVKPLDAAVVTVGRITRRNCFKRDCRYCQNERYNSLF